MKSSSTKKLIVIGGPTGVGKSDLAIRLALHFKGEIINADSRQVYRELSIGVNKPSPEDLAAVTHHLIGHISIHDQYSVGRYEAEALKTIEDLFLHHNIAYLVGGTGLYIHAVLEGLDSFPDIPKEIKTKVQYILESQGITGLQTQLQHQDPEYFAVVDHHNPRRLSRALEVILTTGHKFSALRQANIKPRDFQVIKYFVDDDRDTVYQKIDRRVDMMLDQGLKEEAKRLYPFKGLKSLETVGYKEWFDFFDGKCDEATAILKIKQHSRNYAKRQWTWWKPLNWPTVPISDLDRITKELDQKLNNEYL